jgi:hypothetical protein
MDSIVIKFAANGFILTSNTTDGDEVFSEYIIAHDVNDLCSIVRELVCMELANVDMSHVLTDTVHRA